MISRRFSEFLARLRRGSDESDRPRLAAILALNRALAKAGDKATLLRLLLDEAIALFEAERGFVVRAEDGRLSVEAARSLDREPVRNPVQKLSSTVIWRCLERREGVFAEDAQEGDFGAAQSVADMKLRSVLCMPLCAGDRCLGCVYLDHRFRAGVFKPDDLPWFEAFADQGAIALHLHDLLEQVRARSQAVQLQNHELAARVAAQAREITELAGELSRDLLAHGYPEILGSSPALLRHLHVLDRVAGSDFPVLLVGESGTGKELAARAIHRAGARARGPFVPLHVAAISPALLESELFGHVRGAFTGAERDRRGLLREADGGVLFLDEVTEMPLEVQAKLLRVLEDHTVRPVGGDRAARVDLRVVAATNRSPEQAVAEGRFRRDLYYRLAVVTVEVPPLRERAGDIPELVAHYLGEAARARGAARPRRASRELLERFAARGWPGNLRQLRNEVFRIDAMTGDGVEVIGPELAVPEPEAAAEWAGGPGDAGGTGTGAGVGAGVGAGTGAAAGVELAALERRAVAEALRAADGNKAMAARLLGISRRALSNKLARAAGERDAEPGPPGVSPGGPGTAPPSARKQDGGADRP